MTKGEKTRNLILEKSLELFADNGYAGTPVRKISAAAGIRESAIYNYFKSKSALLDAIFESFESKSTGLDILSDEMINKIDKPYEFLKLFSEELINQWSEEREIKFIRLILKEEGSIRSKNNISVILLLNETRKIWLMIFEQMVKHKFIKKIEPALLADEFIAPLFFIRLEYLLDEKTKDVSSALKRVDEHINFFWDIIKK